MKVTENSIGIQEVNTKVGIDKEVLDKIDLIKDYSGLRFKYIIRNIINKVYKVNYIGGENKSVLMFNFNSDKVEKNIKIDVDTFERLREMAIATQQPMRFFLESILPIEVDLYLEAEKNRAYNSNF